MWPIPKIAKTILTISCRPDSIIYTALHSKRKTREIEIVAYKRIALHNLELAQGALHNPSHIQALTQSFIRQYNLAQACVAVSLQGKEIVEKFITMPSASPHPHDFKVPKRTHAAWNYTYLHAQEDGQFSFYMVSIPQQIIAQYKLLVLKLNLHPLIITTEASAHLALYRHLYGAAFRTSQLALHMHQRNNEIVHHFTQEIVQRIARAHIVSTQPALETPYLATALGLFMLGNNAHETH